MSEARSFRGFEEALRPPVDVRRARMTPAVLRSPRGGTPGEVVARMDRVARRVPETMVKVTGRTRDGAHLRAHLQYIGRGGAVTLEAADGQRLTEPRAVRALADDWAEEARLAGGRRDAPLTHAIVLSMPAGTDAGKLEDAVRAFAFEIFSERFDYVFALHDEGRHPHVHLTVQSLGRDGLRLNPRKADLQIWRERFAHALRERGVEAEATPRRTRGVTRKAEQTALRKMRERFEAQGGPAPRRLLEAAREAAQAENGAPWRDPMKARRARIERALAAEALRMGRSDRVMERTLGAAVVRLVRGFDALETRRDLITNRMAERGGGDEGRGRSR